MDLQFSDKAIKEFLSWIKSKDHPELIEIGVFDPPIELSADHPRVTGITAVVIVPMTQRSTNDE